MKRISTCKMILGIACLASVFTLSQTVYAQKDITTTPSASFLNIEAPFRCSVKETGDIDVSSTIALTKSDFSLSYFDEMDRLPRFEVNGFTFAKMPTDEVLQKLVDEAGIEIYAEDTAYPEISGRDIYGELGTVVSELAAAGDVYYKYDADRKRLYVSHKGRFELQLPDNRLVMFAVLDALRGVEIDTLVPNWKNHSIMLILSHNEEKKVRELMDYILKDSKLMLADIQIYRLAPLTAKANWQKIVTGFGPARIHTAQDGLIGKLLTMGHQEQFRKLKNSLSADYAVQLISQGVAVVPNGWKMRFDVGKCVYEDQNINDLSVLLSTNIKSPDFIDSTMTIDTSAGEIATFNTINALDNELAIIGIPAFEEIDGTTDELLFTVKLRLIRFTQGDK